MTLEFKTWINEALSLRGNYKGNIYQRLVAAKYMLAPKIEADAIPAFQDLANKISRQSKFLNSKFNMTPTLDDPYTSMKAMSTSIDQQKQLGIKRPQVKVFAEPPTQGHPVFSNDQNVTQRGVHDIIAHYFGKHPFSSRGEFNAYNRHLKTLCNVDQVKGGKCLAAQAMFTEVVAQTSCYYVYGTYVQQKAVILRDFDHFNVGMLSSSSLLNNFFYIKNKDLVKKPDFNWAAFYNAQPELADELTRQGGKVPLQPITPSEVNVS